MRTIVHREIGAFHYLLLKRRWGGRFIASWAFGPTGAVNVKVLEECERNSISFICLPPNSTHLTQPLDVSVFRGVKSEWRKLLGQWKENKSNVTLGKEQFPRLLKKLMENIKDKVSINLISGFRACGIVPCDVEALLKRIPGTIERQQDDPISPGDSFIKHLEAKRAEWTEKKKGGKRKKMNVQPGKSVSAEDVIQEGESTNETPSSSRKAVRKRTSVQDEDGNEDDEEENEHFIAQDESDDDIDGLTEQVEHEERENNAFEMLLSNKESIQFAPLEKEAGKFCVVKYMGQLYPGKIVKFDENTAEVSSMQKSLKSWKWPAIPDVLDYPWKDVLGGIQPPKLISKRGFYRVPELDDFTFQ